VPYRKRSTHPQHSSKRIRLAHKYVATEKKFLVAQLQTLHTIDVAKPSLLNKGQDRFTKNSMRLAQQRVFHISGGGCTFINQDGSFTDGEREGERRQGEPHFHFLPAVPSTVTIRLRRPGRPNMRHSAVMPITRIINF
jgi:hypothetical protein